MIFPWVWPVKLITRSEVSATLRPINGPHCEPWMLFSIEIKLKPRINDTVDDFYFELRAKSGQSIKISSPVVGENKVSKGTRLVKNRVIGPFMANFDIDQNQLGISGVDGTREILENFKPFIILKTGFRCKWPIGKRVFFTFQRRFK